MNKALGGLAHPLCGRCCCLLSSQMTCLHLGAALSRIAGALGSGWNTQGSSLPEVCLTHFQSNIPQRWSSAGAQQIPGDAAPGCQGAWRDEGGVRRWPCSGPGVTM